MRAQAAKQKGGGMFFQLRCVFCLLILLAGGYVRSAGCQSKINDREETLKIRTHEGTELSFDISPDGRLIVFDLLGQLWSVPATGGKARALTDAVRDVAEDRDPAFSPDGRFVLFRGERNGRTGLWLLEHATGKVTQLTQLSDPDGFDGQAAWSPDSRSVVFMHAVSPDPASGRPGRLSPFVLDITTRSMSELSIAGTPTPNIASPVWLKDGNEIAFVVRKTARDKQGRVWTVPPNGGRASPVTDEAVPIREPAFSPDGRRIAYFAPDASGKLQIWIRDRDKSDSAKLTNHDDVTATRIRWIPNRNELLYSADGKIWTVALAGGEPKQVRFNAELSISRLRPARPQAHLPEPGKREPARGFMGLAISPDGGSIGMLALGKLWIIPLNGSPREIATVPFDATTLSWSPDGSEVAWSAGVADNEDLFATDIANGKTRQMTALPGREAYPAYSPDGRSLAFVHQAGSSVLRTIDAHGDKVTEIAGTRDLKPIGSNRTCAPQWSPRSDALLVCGGTAANEHATLVPLEGERKTISRFPRAPIFLQWTPSNRIVYVRHDRLWQAGFDGTGVNSEHTALGNDAALYMSAARDGTILYVSDGGLRIRTPAGTVKTIGWPLSFTPPVAERLLIRNVRIISGLDTQHNSDILIANGRIGRIDIAGRIADQSAKVIDAAGRVAIPGLFDLHAHIYRPDLVPGYLYFGITTVRDQGSSMAPLASYAADIASGLLPGPRFAYGGFQYYSDWAFDEEQGRGVEPEADSQHIKRAVDLSEAFGAQHIKTRTFRRWDINARMIAEAHRRGMRVTGHCSHLLPLIAAGMDAKEHIGICESRGNAYMYDDMIQLFKVAGVGVVPTITYLDYAVRLSERPDLLDADPEILQFLPAKENFGWMTRMPAERRAEWAKELSYAREGAVKLLKGGVTLGTGTDIWQNPVGVHMELEQMVSAGLSPKQALRAATLDSARILGVEKDLGSIEVGKRADLVILEADPIADIRNTRKIWNVLQDGRVVDRSGVLKVMKPK
jgi:Tol biopolymer transport system component/imidazolonepropionase-like amidohydrolase